VSYKGGKVAPPPTYSIEVQWADDSVLVPKAHGAEVGSADLTADGKNAARSITYTCSDLYLTVDTISLPEYDLMLRQRLSQESSLQIAIKQYYTFTKDGINAGSDTQVFSVASSSIDRIIGTHRNSSYRTVGIRGWQHGTDFQGDTHLGNYFRFLSLDSLTTKAGTLRTQFTLNNTPFPTYEANVIETLADNCYSVDKASNKDSGMIYTSLGAFHEGLYACPPYRPHTHASGFRFSRSRFTRSVGL
jgi:hypothetical protein